MYCRSRRYSWRGLDSRPVHTGIPTSNARREWYLDRRSYVPARGSCTANSDSRVTVGANTHEYSNTGNHATGSIVAGAAAPPPSASAGYGTEGNEYGPLDTVRRAHAAS